MSVKNFMYIKKLLFGILLTVIVKIENIYQVLWMIQQLLVMKLSNHTTKKQKLFQQILMKRKQLVKGKNYIFYFIYITTAFLTSVIIYCYLIKYQGK